MIHHITSNIWQLFFKDFGSCVYLIKLPKPILIDTSSKENTQELTQNLETLGVFPDDVRAIMLTHNHWDHIGNISLFNNATIYSFTNLKKLQADFPQFKVIETPGHSRDSICLLYGDVLFSGDTIFDKNHTCIGRTDLPESHPEEMQTSLNKLKNLKYRILCPGHIV